MFGLPPRRARRDNCVGCREVKDSASEYVDEALSQQRADEVRRHMDLCPGCGRFMESFKQTVTGLRSLPQRRAPSDLRERLRQQFREAS